MTEIITYVDEELIDIKAKIDHLLRLEDSFWDHENTYEWIIGWSKSIGEFINIRREHFGDKGNVMNPVSITITNHLGHAIKTNHSIIDLIVNMFFVEFDKVLFIGKTLRTNTHRYSIEADKIIFKKGGNVEIIEKEKNGSIWIKFLFEALESGLLLKSKDFHQYVEIKNVDKPDFYYEVERLGCGDFVMSKFTESEREIPFDLRGFDFSCNNDFESNEERFITAVKNELLKL